MIDAEADVAVVGAGVLGLAIAAELARRGRDVVVIERETGAGRITSSRNSGVIHAGIYYPKGSLKAETCIEGRALLYERAARLGIPHRKTGKLVVAADADEAAMLEPIRARAAELGVPLETLDGRALAQREPVLRGVAALFSPESGIVDAHALVESYRVEAKTLGASYAFASEVRAIEPVAGALVLTVSGPDGATARCRAERVVSASGLDADHVASTAGLDVDVLRIRQTFVKGDYFVLERGAPLPTTALVYPPPTGPGLGIHITIGLDGACLVGPDATHVASPKYDVDPDKAAVFAAAVSRYLPGVRAAQLTPGYAGVRPKLDRPAAGFADFAIVDTGTHGVPGLVCLAGIESPGLTAAAALARRVAAVLA